MAALRARNLIAAAGLIALASMIASCSSPSSTSSSTSAAAPGASPDPALWGAMKPIVSVKELMHNLIDPVADNVFDSVAIIVDKNKTTDIQPRTAEDWDKVAIGGTMLAEASYLLKVKRPFAPPGEKETLGAEEVELTPDEMTAKVQKDPVEWNARIEALRNVGLQVLDIVKRKDTQELWDAADNLEMACENCHRSYWYPGETSAYYSSLDKRLREHSLAGPRAPAPEKPATPKRTGKPSTR
jgi:hypothetical protein